MISPVEPTDAVGLDTAAGTVDGGAAQPTAAAIRAAAAATPQDPRHVDPAAIRIRKA